MQNSSVHGELPCLPLCSDEGSIFITQHGQRKQQFPCPSLVVRALIQDVGIRHSSLSTCWDPDPFVLLPRGWISMETGGLKTLTQVKRASVLKDSLGSCLNQGQQGEQPTVQVRRMCHATLPWKAYFENANSRTRVSGEWSVKKQHSAVYTSRWSQLGWIVGVLLLPAAQCPKQGAGRDSSSCLP